MNRTSPILRRLSIVTVLTVAICSGQEAQNSQPHPHRVPGKKLTVQGVPNFGEVTPTLFRGAQPSHEGFEALAKRGVDIIVDARGGDRAGSEGKEVSRLGMKYVAIPWECSSPRNDVFARFLKLLQDNPDKKIFVHCLQGVDRTGMMIASYRMAGEGWSADDALIEMKDFGFSGSHHFFCPRLASYEQSFPTRLKSSPEFEGLRSVPARSSAAGSK